MAYLLGQWKITQKKNLLRRTDFTDYTTFTCLYKAYQDFIFKLSDVIDILCPNKTIKIEGLWNNFSNS